MTLWHLVLITLIGLPCVSASNWEDFTNNLATDLAPLITLFGERLTKQFLSESTTTLDNIIFALSPLGILTTVVSVIRICGTSSLRAFVGRAQEGPGEAESELLPCVSETTAELFNDGGISRVFGRPRILEVVVWEEASPGGLEGSREIGTLRDALRDEAWVERSGRWVAGENGGLPELPELDIPNLSLNKGIKRRGAGWFYSAALLGFVLQMGTLVYAAVTVFVYPDLFKKSGKHVQSYAFPFYLYGTISVAVGMFLCAFMIERSSSEYYLYPTKPSKIYWLQPGRQKVGEQDFGAFLAVNEGHNAQATEKLSYTKSIRGPPPRGKGPLLVFTIFITMVGFVIQFVGLQGLHASVILVELGSTLVMATVRTCLRTKRLGTEGNVFRKEERALTSHNQQELDCFAFHLENVDSFRLVSSSVHESNRSRSGSCSTASSTQYSASLAGIGMKLIQTRARLAELTSDKCRHSSMDWDDLPIRKTAQNLANTIEMTMDLVSTWKDTHANLCSFELSFACQRLSHKSTGSTLETYPILLKRSDDTLQWKVDANALEAVLGLWTLSLLKLNPKWLQNGLGRSVGLTRAEASAETTDLYFHKWIFRQREAKMVSSKMISFSEQMFGYYSDEYPGDKDILVVKTDNRLEVMAAQDIYIQFLMSIFADLTSLGGEVDVLQRSQNVFTAKSTHLDELVYCFEAGNLGSKEDGLLCIVPVLKHRKLLPDLAADSSSVRRHIKDMLSAGDWNGAFSILQWLCERCEGEEFERSVYELGLLCQKAMLQRSASIRQQGFETVRSLLQCDIRARFFKSLGSPRPSEWMESMHQRTWWTNFSNQLGWITWHIANSRVDRQEMKIFLESLGFSESLILHESGNDGNQLRATAAQRTLLGCLVPEIDAEFQGSIEYGNATSWSECLEWVVQTKQPALCHWLLASWADVGQNYPQLAMRAFVFAAQSSSGLAVRTLCQQGADINALGDEGCTALVEVVATENKEASKNLLAHGADANFRTKVNGLSPLTYAAIQGSEEILLLLLDYGADLELRDGAGFTPLHAASNPNCLNTATILLDRGADIEAIARDGSTPLILATTDRHIELVELLLQRGANINAADNDGSTALMLAVSLGCKGIVHLLLDKKADIHRQDIVGRTALDLAKELGFAEIEAVLEAAL